MKLTIDRKIWLRGQRESALLVKSGKMCCVGIYLNACGVSSDDLYNILDPSYLEIPKKAKWLTCSSGSNSKSSIDLMNINDKIGTKLKKRETEIKKIFKKHN
ncbi:MAG: hypothetical protein AABY22_30190, partial [Nanoarchaeota archaeon]